MVAFSDPGTIAVASGQGQAGSRRGREGPRRVSLTVPLGATPGEVLKGKTPAGREFSVAVPDTVKPGKSFLVTVPPETVESQTETKYTAIAGWGRVRPGDVLSLDEWRVARPPRASHDRKTGRCVAKFDHYCPWVGNSVGERNYVWFLLFVAGVCALSWTRCAPPLQDSSRLPAPTLLSNHGALGINSLGGCVYHVVDSALRIEREKGISAGRAWGKAVGGAVGSVLLACYLIVAATLTTALLLLHVYLVSTGRTTAEFFKGTFRGVTNPHDRGCLANWRALLLPRASNWCSLPPTGMASPPPSPGSEVQLTA